MNKALELTVKAASQGKLAHFLLFHGGSRSERCSFAWYLAKILNCLDEAGRRPCGQCSSCHKISSGNHPDVLKIESTKSTLGIEQILAWQQKVYRPPYEGRCKVFLLEKGDTLTLPAGNALLKVVEEPPPNTLIILSADNGEGILPTLQSRAQSIYFPALSAQEWIDQSHVFAEKTQEEVRAAFALSGHEANLAEEVLSLGVAKIEGWTRAFWEAVNSRDFLKLSALFPLEKGEAPLYLQVMAVQIREEVKSGKADPKAFLAVGEAMGALKDQANPRLVLEVLALSLFD